MKRELEELIWSRAHRCCEYCQHPEEFSELPFEIDHIIATKHRGETTQSNLALSCFYCNSYKGPNIAGRDTNDDELTRLYHPRNDTWSEHFGWNEAELLGLTDVGRTTIDVLRINHPDAVDVRIALIEEGVFPPHSPNQ